MQIFGSKAAVRIKGDPSAMAARGIAVDDLASAIKGGTSTVGAGQFDAPSGTLLLSPHGQLDKAEAYDDLIVGTRNGAPVHLRDVAKASDSVQDERVRIAFWVKGHPVPGSAVVVALLRLRDRLYHLMANFTGKSAETIHRDFDRNKWLFADEAVSYGCADKIVERAPENMPRAKRDEDDDIR